MSPNGHEPLNGLSGLIEIKGYFERILVERDRVDAERMRTDAERMRGIDERFKARDEALAAALTAAKEAVAAAFEAAKEAVAKAEVAQSLAVTSLKTASEKWQDEHNNLLREVVTQKENFPTKKELSDLRDELNLKLENAETRLAAKTDEQDTRLDLTTGHRTGVSASIAALLAVGGLAIGVLFFVLSHY
jgi:hypothetical protein